jgi:hypothetical protein
MADKGRLTVDQKVNVVLFYTETKSVAETQRLFVHAMVQGGLLANRQFTDFANNFKLMVLCWRRSGHVPPVSVRLQSCDKCEGLFAWGCEAKRWSHWTCSALATIFQPIRINSVPDFKCFCNKKKCVMCTINGMTFRAPPCSCLNTNYSMSGWRHLCEEVSLSWWRHGTLIWCTSGTLLIPYCAQWHLVSPLLFMWNLY